MTDRVLLDGEGDRWFEVLPGKFSWGFSRFDAERRAHQGIRDGASLYDAQTVARVHGGVTDVTPPAKSIDVRAAEDVRSDDVQGGNAERFHDYAFSDLTNAWKRGYHNGLTDGRNGA